MQVILKSMAYLFLVLKCHDDLAAGNSEASLVDVFKAFAGFGNHTSPPRTLPRPALTHHR